MSNWFGSISANFLMFLIWVGGFIVNLIVFWILDFRRRNDTTTSAILIRLDRLERVKDRTTFWAKDSFGVELNGD